MEQVYWTAPLGGFDDFGLPYKGVMIDGKTKQGPWANMTRESWEKHGVGRLGTGYGQKYVEQKNVDDVYRWIKVEG